MQPYGMSDEEMEAAGISLGSAQPGQEQRMVVGHKQTGGGVRQITASDLGEDGELVERLRDEATALERAAWSRPDGGQDGCIAANLANEAADRLILYREALVEARSWLEFWGGDSGSLGHVLQEIDDVLGPNPVSASS